MDKNFGKKQKNNSGGNMLLSKDQRCTSQMAGQAFSKTEGCSVWDLDGIHYHDLYSWVLELIF